MDKKLKKIYFKVFFLGDEMSYIIRRQTFFRTLKVTKEEQIEFFKLFVKRLREEHPKVFN